MTTLKQTYLFFLSIFFTLLAYTYFKGYFSGPFIFGIGLLSIAVGLLMNHRNHIPITQPAKYLIGIILIFIACSAGANIHIALLGDNPQLSRGDVHKLWFAGFAIAEFVFTLASLFIVLCFKLRKS